ncbi:MAG: hypothetical protein OJK14_07160 [Achromobacter sp.]|uniref:hypothetical protein n=1 Tax=Achromobacter sp. TaxID=134375 RepID=UPI0025912684|nr:hypothetical protein [Achromobacter sp.]MCW0206859.1 hypothetical protein [Achromobacter sp.]
MNTDRKRDTGQPRAQRDPAKPQANTPRDESEAARRSGQFGADRPGFGKPPPHPERGSDKKPNDKGPEYEEGGQYPGKRPEGK